MRQQVLDFLKKEIDQEHIPGAVVQIAQDGKVLLEEALGFRAVYPEKEAMDLQTVFDLASLTKVIATLPAVLKLLDIGDVHLEDDVHYFLPAFKQKGKENITVKHLLTHTSGLTSHQPFYEKELSADKVLNEIFTDENEIPVGSKVVYSDLGFITLYKIVEEVTGIEFSKFVSEEIFSPLEMTETGFNPSFPESRYAATEFSEDIADYKRGIVHDENTHAMGGVSGHAGLFSTLGDLSKFAEMIEQGGLYKGKRLLSERSLEIARENYTPWDTEHRGLGWHLQSPNFSPCGDYFSEGSYGHTGFTGTSIWFDPEINLRIILLTNRVHFGRKPHIIRLRPRLHNIVRSYF